jgi:hypothetical protein
MSAVTVTRISRARFQPGVDYFPDDRCSCGRELGEAAGALDVLDADDNWVDGEFLCARCARRADGEAPQQLITEADVIDPITVTGWLELEAERLDWEYWEDVRSCCGGRSWSCIHWGSYPPPRDWPQP